MTEHVKIHLKTAIQHADGEQEAYELWANGTLQTKGAHHYLRYDEVQEEGTVNTTVKFGHDEALILRSGAISMRLPFLTNAKQTGNYGSPYGTLMVETTTKQILFETDPTRALHIIYDMNLAGNNVGTYTLDFTITEGTP